MDKCTGESGGWRTQAVLESLSDEHRTSGVLHKGKQDATAK